MKGYTGHNIARIKAHIEATEKTRKNSFHSNEYIEAEWVWKIIRCAKLLVAEWCDEPVNAFDLQYKILHRLQMNNEFSDDAMVDTIAKRIWDRLMPVGLTREILDKPANCVLEGDDSCHTIADILVEWVEWDKVEKWTLVEKFSEPEKFAKMVEKLWEMGIAFPLSLKWRKAIKSYIEYRHIKGNDEFEEKEAKFIEN